MSHSSTYATASLLLLMANFSRHTTQPASSPQVAFCVLPDSTITGGARNLNWTLKTDSSWALLARQHLHTQQADTIREALSRPDCDTLAGSLAERQAITSIPVAAYRYGTGYLLYQPSGGGPGYRLTVVDSNNQVVEALGQVVFE